MFLSIIAFAVLFAYCSKRRKDLRNMRLNELPQVKKCERI